MTKPQYLDDSVSINEQAGIEENIGIYKLTCGKEFYQLFTSDKIAVGCELVDGAKGGFLVHHDLASGSSLDPLQNL